MQNKNQIETKRPTHIIYQQSVSNSKSQKKKKKAKNQNNPTHLNVSKFIFNFYWKMHIFAVFLQLNKIFLSHLKS